MTTTTSNRVFVAESHEIPEGGRLVVEATGKSFGVFRFKGNLTAFENLCPHQGGPVCQGALTPGVTEVLDENRATLRQDFDQDRLNIVCPWHGFEFDVTTGQHAGARGPRLREFQVTEAEGRIYVDI